MATRYLRQLKTGRIYIVPNNLDQHPGITLRKDMVPFDPEKARKRIEANKQIIEDAKSERDPKAQEEHAKKVADLAALAKDLTATENMIDDLREENLRQELDLKEPPKTTAEMEAERRANIVESDEDIKTIKGMRKVETVAKYIEKEFGEDIPVGISLEAIKDLALDLRAKRIFEGL